MRHQKIHGNILTVHILVHLVPDGLGQPVPVEIRVMAVHKGSPRQHHAQFAAVVGIIEPARVVHVPGMVATGEAHHAVTVLSPHPGTSGHDVKVR